MATFLTNLLEGQNLSEFEKFSNDGDIRHLGIVGRNLTLAARYERSAAEVEMESAKRRAENEAEVAASRARDAAFAEELHMEAIERAVELTAKVKEGVKSPLSDDGVDDFLRF